MPAGRWREGEGKPVGRRRIRAKEAAIRRDLLTGHRLRNTRQRWYG
jgi:hypothetical protein